MRARVIGPFWERSGVVEVALDDEALTVGARRYPRSEIRYALIVPRRPADVLRLVRPGRPNIDLVLEDPRDTERLADALEKSAFELRLAQTTMMAPLGAAILVAMAIISHLRIGRTASALSVAIVCVIALLAIALLPRRVRVGADGVLDASPWRRRFIPLADIEGVRAFSVERRRSRGARYLEHHVVIDLRDGQVDLPAGDEEQAAILQKRIADLFRKAQHGAPRDFAAVLERGGRSNAAWLAHLRGLVAQSEEGYRVAAIDRDELVEAAVDPNGAPHLRIAAAAAALGPGVAPEARARIAQATAASAEPHVRVAMERLLDEDPANDEAIAEALAEVDAASREASG